MQNDFKITLTQETLQNLQAFSEILQKDVNTILQESLEQYFEAAQQTLMEKNRYDENAMTNLDFDEFWGDVELD